MRFARILFAMALVAVATPAFAQSSIINSGAVTPGRAPMYVQGGVGSQVVATDSGPAGGGNVGLGLSELLLTARGTGTPPYVGQGTGPLGTNVCDYDAPITNATGYHYLCWGPNPGQMVFGYGGAASANPFSFIINGATYTFPTSGVGGNLATFTSPTTANVFPCWANTVGLLSDCSIAAATLVGNPSSSGAKAVAFTIQSLPQRASLDANNDKVLLYNNSTGAFNYATPAQIAVSETAGVSSLGGVTGAITLGGTLQMSGQQLQNPPAGSSGQILWNNGGAQAGFTATGDVSITPSTGVTTINSGAVTSSKIAVGGVANSNLAVGAANTMKGSLNGTTTSDITLVACSAVYQFTQWVSGTGWQCGITPVLPSRATAATVNLSAFSSVKVLGNATPGDGGEATFKEVSGATPFVDTSIQSGSITSAGSGCTTGPYYGVSLSGGTGNLAVATVVASGGAVTSVTITYPGSAYSVGDVLTGTITGCTFTWTVSAITTPTGSFADSVGTRFQIVYPASGIDARAFGVKFDWTTSDSGATDNYTTLNNVYHFAGAQIGGGPDTGGTIGGLVLLPRGTAMYCGSNGAATLSQPYGVTVRGQGPYESALKPCDAWGTSTNFYELCNSQSHLACFGTLFDSAQIFASATHDSGSSQVSGLNAVYTNNCQQEGCGLRNAVIYPGACRRGATFEIGYGGASIVHALDDVEFKGGQKAASCGGNAAAQVFVNYGTTQVTIDRLTVSGFSSSFSGPRDNGLVINGGFIDIHAFYGENVVDPGIVNIQGSLANGMVRVHNTTAGTSCTWIWQLASTNQPGNFLIGGPMATNSCSSGIVQDGQSGGTNMTTPQISDKIFNP